MAIKSLVASHFQQLLSAEPVFPEEMDMENLEDGLTDEDRRFLCDMPMREEVRETVFTIEPESVAGPDGFGAFFYHTCWDFVSEDVFRAVTDFFWGVVLPKSFTATTISLFPKTDNPTSWSKYRPISLCNVTNKICTKLMTIRLGRALLKVLSLSQSGFVPGRLLSDNVLLAQELIHSLESRRADANVIFKLGMAKAYDRNMELLRIFYEHINKYREMINDEKSSFIVRRQVLALQTQSVQNVMGYRLKYLPVTYLGVPLYKGTSIGFPVKRNLHLTLVPYNRNHSAVWYHLCHIRDVVSRLSSGLWATGQKDKIVWTGPVMGCSRREQPGRLSEWLHLDDSFWQISGFACG
ncbi:UNVERIFIED_CONTAM: hypothetical protein Sradi_5754900 [Sesamum radiatum]|uniref:Reverse transcriptase domain-containing protein n=1 Tax=Sesamum radiatum TaxID=300843 RepID=A0AAW2L6T2_SESRA